MIVRDVDEEVHLSLVRSDELPGDALKRKVAQQLRLVVLKLDRLPL